MKRIQIFEEFINEIGTPVNKESLKVDVESSVSIMKNLLPGISTDSNVSRFASGSKSELYMNFYFKNSKEEQTFIQKIENQFPTVGTVGSLNRTLYQDKTNHVYFRIVRVNDNESSIIFNRNIPKSK